MSGLVTKETHKSVSNLIQSIQNVSKREDSEKLLSVIKEISGYEPKIWGDNFIIGFGKYKYKRKEGKEELEWFHIGFAPRKTKLTVYLTYDINQEEDLIKKLGKCKYGKGCLHFNKLSDINLETLKQLIEKSKDTKWH